MTSPGEREAHPEVEATKESVIRDIDERLRHVTGWLPHGDALDDVYAPGQAVPERLVERDAPGLAGTDYWDLVRMAEEMHDRDPNMRYDSLRIIGDEIWNFADGSRSINQIADAVGAEFEFDLEPRPVLKLFQGLAGQGFVRFLGNGE